MGRGKAQKPSKLSHRNKGNPLGPKTKKRKKEKKQRLSNGGSNENPIDEKASNQSSQNSDGLSDGEVQPASASAQLSFFLDKFQSADGVQLSSLELESFNDKCIMDLSESLDQDVSILGKHVKEAFGPSSWKQELCEKDLVDGKIDSGSPAILIISTSAFQALELLRGFRLLTNECGAAKLFSKHMTVEEQDKEAN